MFVRPAYYGYYSPFFWYPGRYPYGFYDPFYYGHSSRHVRSARLQVTPREPEVYVDGYLAGTVDDFDGFLQRLDVRSERHML